MHIQDSPQLLVLPIAGSHIVLRRIKVSSQENVPLLRTSERLTIGRTGGAMDRMELCKAKAKPPISGTPTRINQFVRIGRVSLRLTRKSTCAVPLLEVC